MEEIEEYIRIFERPSSFQSREMADYIYFLENKIKDSEDNNDKRMD